jgi:2,4-dienoyl-CoA reductase (NADPH2)
VTPQVAAAALADGVCDLVEMTRAQIADPHLVRKLRQGQAPRPCVLCNQACRVRDARNPLVSCIGEPRSGHETQDAAVPEQRGAPAGDVLVVGAGPAGLECARVLALQGFSVEVRDAGAETGGAVRDAALGAGRGRLGALVDWLAAECERLGAKVRLESTVDREELAAYDGQVVLATGSRARETGFVDARAALRGALPDGPVLVHDPVGGPVGVSVAELLAASGREVRIVTQDPVVGTLLSLTGDLADCNTRLQRLGVTRELRSLLRKASDGRAVLQDVWTGAERTVPAAVVVDCGPRLPEEELYETGALRAGDCVAPRTILEAVLEGRRAALAVASS